MKKLSRIIIYLWCISVNGQGFSKAEYFFDSDPGINNATQIIIGNTSDTAIVNTSISIASLSAGFHFLGIRFKHNDGSWGLFEHRKFYVYPLPTSDISNIIAAEYFFDTDPGKGNGTPVSVGASGATVNFSAIIPEALSPGFHFLAIRTMDSENKWGQFETRKFYLSSPFSNDVSDIVAAEYFFDSDPGTGNGISLSVGPSGAIVNFAATIPSSLSAGFHFLNIRTKDANGKWGLFESRRFYLTPPTLPDMPAITAAEYFFDSDPGEGNAIPLVVPVPGDNVNFSTGILVPCLTVGQHFVGLRVRDSQNHWSLFGYDTISQTAAVATASITPIGPDTVNLGNFVTLSAPNLTGFTYQWLMDGNNISGANNRTYNAGLTANYSVKRTCNENFSFSNLVAVYALLNLDIKLFIEGYYTGLGFMDNSGLGGCLFINGASLNSSDADSVFISLVDPVSLAETHHDTVILKTNGSLKAIFTDFTVQGLNYFIRVKHRNANETWSSVTVTMNTFTNYDFTTSPTKAFGNNMVETSDHVGWAFYSGDINQDKTIDATDFLELDPIIQNGDSGYLVGDLNGDGSVDATDFLLMDPNIQNGVSAAYPLP